MFYFFGVKGQVNTCLCENCWTDFRGDHSVWLTLLPWGGFRWTRPSHAGALGLSVGQSASGAFGAASICATLLTDHAEHCFTSVEHWCLCVFMRASQGSVVKNLPAMQEPQVSSLGREDPLEDSMATHSSILAWRISWTEKPGGRRSTGSQEWDTSEVT